jgi:Ni,Fe-hydrogenase III large subunit
MRTLRALIEGGRTVAQHRPWPRVLIDDDAWHQLVAGLGRGDWTMLGLWGERAAVNLCLMDEEAQAITVFGLECPGGHFPSVGRLHPPAIRLERAIHDLFGLIPDEAPDLRPWLDHGKWPQRHPLGAVEPAQAVSPYAFLPVEGESLHQIPVGPVHAGIIEPGHFRFTANGEAVVRLEERLGYVHKGVEGLMAGANLERAAKLAGRVSGDSTLAYGLGFARAAEAALSFSPPPRAVWLRALMAELERIANHFGDIGAICNDASFVLMHAQCGFLREQVLRAADLCFGHRLMRDCIVPGGVAIELDARGAAHLQSLIPMLRARFAPLIALYDSTASLQDRTVGTGRLTLPLARQFGAGGPIGRASGRAFDARKMPGYAPYDQLRFEVPARDTGDVDARVWLRIEEIGQSFQIIEQILAALPNGSVRTDLPAVQLDGPREGMALIEAFRGDLLVWLRLHTDGTVARCHLRDASWFQWPLLEAAIEGNIVADFPLCNKSFNCSYSGHDL